jgi:hypothetical protein
MTASLQANSFFAASATTSANVRFSRFAASRRKHRLAGDYHLFGQHFILLQVSEPQTMPDHLPH